MKLKRLSQIFLLTSCVWLWGAISATAKEVPIKEVQSKSVASVLRNYRSLREIPRLSQIELPSTSATMLVQSPTPSPGRATQVVPITGVKANATAKGVEIILQTTAGTELQVVNRSTGNNFIADIIGGQLRLPDGNVFTFRSSKPVAGITEVVVTNLDANTVRITVAGEKTLPVVELYDDTVGLVFGIASQAVATQPPQQPEQPATQTPSAQQDESIELVVTGEQDGYRVPNASVGTRTDTPLRDIPQTINVVPQEVLRDQNVTSLNEALRNVPGATINENEYADSFRRSFIIRGFGASFLNNGFGSSQSGVGGGVPTTIGSNLERIEVLSGPASVLYGTGQPGGTINLVTKQPLSNPFYAIDATIGNYDFYQGAIDLTGPLNDARTVLYRLNVDYLNRGSFVDFVSQENVSVAPVVSFVLGERTRLTLETGYRHEEGTPRFSSLPVEGTTLPNPNGRIPRNRSLENPDTVEIGEEYSTQLRLEHQFSDNWSLQSALFWRQQRVLTPEDSPRATREELQADGRTLVTFFRAAENEDNFYNLSTNLTGKFATGSVRHQLTFGVDLNRFDSFSDARFADGPPDDLFNLNYGIRPTEPFEAGFVSSTITDTLGIYTQDLVTLTPNLKLLLGGRFDLYEQTDQNFVANTITDNSANAFTPRVGIVYQPIKPISLYASYSRSFSPVFGKSFEGDVFQPERGTQYEVGIKADVNDRLAATLAFYNLTRTGVLTTDNRPGVPRDEFSIQTGEQRSRGVELSIAGEILPGWNILAGYAYTDAKLTEDNVLPVGNRLENTPENSVNLWTTYQFQRGPLQGFGLGLGLFFVGERQQNLENNFPVPGYLRTDASIFYRRGHFRTALNVRNLFDIDYFEFGNGRGVYYGAPFSVEGTIRWEF